MLKRLTSETPKFFKAVRNVCALVAVVSTSLAGAGMAVPTWLIAAGAVGAGIAQMAKENE